MIGRFGRSLTLLYSFDGKEETGVEINLSISWGRGESQVLLDIAHPFIRELVAKRDGRLVDMLEELIPFGLGEIEKAIESQDRELEEEECESESAIGLPKIRPGYIYLIKAGDGYYKIGRSKNVEVRMREIGLQLPFPFEVLHVISTKDMYRGEDDLHNRYAHCHLNGEWFALTEEDVQAICSITEL